MAAMTNNTSPSFQAEGDTKSDSNVGLGFSSILGALKTVTPHMSTPDRQLEYLFEDEYVATGPSWGARICYGAGVTYLTGLATGGIWGLADGLRNPAGRTTRLRINCILNSCTARGPFVANNFAMLALLYNLIHGGIIKAREGKYDLTSSTASATLAGIIYKSTRGLKAMGITGALFGSGMLAFQLTRNYYEQRSLLHLQSN